MRLLDWLGIGMGALALGFLCTLDRVTDYKVPDSINLFVQSKETACSIHVMYTNNLELFLSISR